MKRGLFITFEGIDGCGKSAQVKMLNNYVSQLSKYNHVLNTRQPYKNQDIRKILQEDSDPYSQGRKLAEMFVADRKKHVFEMIMPILDVGGHVISDRYDLSTLAYQQTQGVSLQELIEMHSGIIMPDLTFIVDVPAEVAIERMKKDTKRNVEQKFEKQIEFIKKLRQNYLDLQKQLPGRNIVIIDANPSIEEIFEKQIKPAFDNLWAEYEKR
jgi:dTMP kinase